MSRKSFPSNTQPMYVLEESFYPDAWRDDSRMGVLLTEFRTRTVNPENYDSKMRFWKELIVKYCGHEGSGSVSITELKRVFKRKGTSPYCLSTVFEDMMKEGQLVAKVEFLKMPQETWSGWAVDVMVKRPFGWGFGKVKEKLVGNVQDESAEFICMEVIKSQSNMLEKLIQKENKYNVLLSRSSLTELVKKLNLSGEAIDLVLHHLLCRQRVFMEKLPSEEDHEKKVLLKFAVPGAQAQPITDIERSIYNLEQTEHDLMKVIEKLEQNISDTMVAVKQNLRDGKKQLAKSNLKKMHLLEKNLDKKMNVLDNVQTMVSRIHDSQSDRHVIDAYKIGSNALKTAFADSGITLDSVDDTLAEMKEILEQQDEMQTMISTPQNTDVDDLELEQELSDLIDVNLAANNIVAPPATPGVAPPTIPGAGGPGQPTLAQLNEFDKEIEKRLLALRMDVPSPPPSDTSISAGTSVLPNNNLPSTRPAFMLN
ncbi:charged multivesicular body protein 7 [Ochlerotatus camptorhynchus]|uniref:charged multivesicular body protein 7 n=1 Tax=Ochlerotatus camptorhynchus TaxID=644619 RepID=UPI0031DF0F7D